MKVTDVWKDVDRAGLPGMENDYINKTLDRMSKGKFSFKEKFELAVIGVSTKDMRELADCAKIIVDNEYGGNAKQALQFLKDVEKSGLGPLDFSQLVRNGTAHTLITMQKSDPDRFERVIAGQYPDVAALNVAMGASPTANASPGLATTRPAAAPRAPS